MAKAIKTLMLPDELVMNKIYLIRGQKVMLDRDLAALYQVKTGVLNQAIKRNARRFPPDFMFQLTQKEFENWKSQIVIFNSITESATNLRTAATVILAKCFSCVFASIPQLVDT